MDERNKFRGSMLGLAAGDALGTTLEFNPPGTFDPITDIIGGGPFHLKPGQWTDDTSLALCLAESLIEKERFDPVDQLQRYVRWYREGHLSSTGDCFDIGNTTRSSLHAFLQTGEPYGGAKDAYHAGNGSIMRLAPVPLFYAGHPEEAIQRSADSSRTTHGAVHCLDACRYLGGLIVGAVLGVEKEELLSPRYGPLPGYWEMNPLAPEIDEVAAGSFKQKEPPEIEGTGYVVKSLEAALWAFQNSRSFEEGCLLAVNLGDDADTTGAVYGQLAGAYYGEGSIPKKWRQTVSMSDLIVDYADRLLSLSSLVKD